MSELGEELRNLTNEVKSWRDEEADRLRAALRALAEPLIERAREEHDRPEGDEALELLAEAGLIDPKGETDDRFERPVLTAFGGEVLKDH